MSQTHPKIVIVINRSLLFQSDNRFNHGDVSGISDIEDAMHRGRKEYGDEDQDLFEGEAKNCFLLAPPSPLQHVSSTLLSVQRQDRLQWKQDVCG